MNNASTLMWGVLFGSIGLGFFVYGKKQKTITPFFCGIGLMTIPYFISNLLTALDNNPIEYENESLFYPPESKELHEKFLVYRS